MPVQLRNLLLLLLLALVPLATLPSTPAAPHVQAGKADLTRPRIMSQAADIAAAPATYQAQSAARPTAPTAQAVAPAAANTGRPRKEVFGFVNAGNLGDPNLGYPSWNLGLLTTVAFFALHINSGDGAIVRSGVGYNVWISSTLTSFVSAAHAAGTKVVVSINLHDFSTAPNNQVCQGLISTSAQNTVNEAWTQVRNANIDGVNIDYEGQDTVCSNGLTARQQLVSFVQNMKAAAPAGKMVVIDTYAGSAEDNLEFFNITGLSPYVDAFFVMSYDSDVDNATLPPLNCTSYCMNPVSPLNTYRFNVTKTVSQYTALVPGSQVILGQPYYARRGCVTDLTTPHQNATAVVSTTYRFAVNAPTESGVSSFAAHRDPSEGVSEWDTWHDSDPTVNCNRMQYWDDVYSLGAKYDLVNSTNIRGVGIFALDYAGAAPELWNSIAAHFTCPGTNFITGDFNGDTKTDLAVIGSQSICVLASTGSAFGIPTVWASIPFYGSVVTLAGDVTGDGKADIVAVNGGQTFVLPSIGLSFGSPQGWSALPFYGTRGTYLADVNGDGKADLVAVNSSSVWVMLSTGTSFSAPAPWSGTTFFGNVTTAVADVTGDGKADMVAINSGSMFVMPSTGSNFAAPNVWSSTPFYGTLSTFLGNVSGAGKADAVALNYTSAWVMTSTGAAFNGPAPWTGTAFYGQQATLAGDFNGDGKIDLVAVNNLSVWVEPSTGTGFSAPVQWLSGPP